MTVRASAADLAMGDHVCLPLDSEQQRLAFAEAFAERGLRTGNQVIFYTESLPPSELDAWLAHGGFTSAGMMARLLGANAVATVSVPEFSHG